MFHLAPKRAIIIHVNQIKYTTDSLICRVSDKQLSNNIQFYGMLALIGNNLLTITSSTISCQIFSHFEFLEKKKETKSLPDRFS